MLKHSFKTLFILALLATIAVACSALRPPATPTPEDQAASEATVPRVTVEEARAAFERGEAVIVDVRSAESFAARHIAGAISIPLTQVEADPTSVQLDKNQWIITYCT